MDKTSNKTDIKKIPIVKYTVDKDGYPPCKNHPTDACWDVMLVKRFDVEVDEVGKTTMFGTGLILEPPEGYHCLLFSRSSLHKLGYRLATGVSVIDNGYRGEILVPLTKESEGEDLVLPFRGIQIYFEKTKKIHLAAVNVLQVSERGSSGFGSSGYSPLNSTAHRPAILGDSSRKVPSGKYLRSVAVSKMNN